MTHDRTLGLFPTCFLMALDKMEVRDSRRRFDEARLEAYQEHVRDLAERTVRGKDEHEVRVYVPPHVYGHMWEIINRLEVCSSSGYREMRFFVAYGTILVKPRLI